MPGPSTDTQLKQAKIEALQARAASEKQKAKYLREQARQQQAWSDKAEIERDKAQEARAKELVEDDKVKFYPFVGGVDNGSAKSCINKLRQWNRTDPGCDIEIQFFSPGGSVIAGMALYDTIKDLRRDGHDITTSTIGYAASMGGILLQAGDTRIMGKEAYILIHEVQAAALGTMGEIEDEVEFLKMIQKRILRIFAERSVLSVQQLGRRWKRKNWWLDSDEALRLGIVDEVRE